MLSMHIHDMRKITLKVEHYPATAARSHEFWSINQRTLGEDDSALFETSTFTHTEPKELIALCGGVETLKVLFDATPVVEVLT